MTLDLNDLIDQEELEESCPIMVEELTAFIESEGLFESEEATIYALAQLIHNRIGKINLSLEDKGAVVSSIITGLVEFNDQALAAHHERIRSIREQKASTIH